MNRGFFFRKIDKYGKRRYSRSGACMTPSCSYIIRAGIMAGCLAVAGCQKPSDSISPVQKPVARSVVEQADSHRLNAGDRPGPERAGAVAKKPEVPEPLDLSMPPQPKFDMGALEGKRSLNDRLLPDLFEPEKNPGANPLSLKGRVFMQNTGQENLDAIDGGQLIIEMKTR
jgi:hypothetical protein